MKKYLFWILCLAMCSFLISEKMILESSVKEIKVTNSQFRGQQLNEELVNVVRNTETDKRGTLVGKYLATRMLPVRFSKKNVTDDMKDYISFCNAIWKDVEYFPVVEDVDGKYTTNYVDTWAAERTFGGDRTHEGTDIMASKDKPGIYPVVSMTDGIVTHKGWLPLGGWRVGILSSSGAYFYYAHLESYADISIGEEIKAGEIIGFMGNSGYGEEGTTGKFATHLHLGIYIYPDGIETSINPYWILKVAEEKKLFCSY